MLKPDANIGLSLDGYLVIDVDPRHGGDSSLVDIESQYGPLPKTRRARSGGGGEHIYFRLPAGVAVKNDNKGGLGTGLDIKAKGGYTLAPPSLHESGNRYTWLDNIPAVEPPGWLIEKLQQEPDAKVATPPEAWRQLVGDGVDDGRRDVTITRLTGHLLRRFVDPHVVFELMKRMERSAGSPAAAA
jgi:hypothetical protein